mmetsp:Transcript_13400/g.22337  ORF Transcript_13400/g.22337 Transcript_13400/m.22337 type:complete len:296 (+) Transcript_13400:523-1410(+)
MIMIMMIIRVVTTPQRLDVLADMSKSEKVVPTSLAFVDIAGLVAGASKGEGLGNKFLANIRECDAIVHVVRCFEDANIVHVDGSVDPLRDIDTINLELILSDIEQIERTLQRAKKGKQSDQQKLLAGALERIFEALNSDKPARFVELDPDEELAVKSLGLLTKKPVIYAANVIDTDLSAGNEMVDKVRQFAGKEGAEVVIISAQVESELVDLDPDERKEFLDDPGVCDIINYLCYSCCDIRVCVVIEYLCCVCCNIDVSKIALSLIITTAVNNNTAPYSSKGKGRRELCCFHFVT